MMGDEPESKGEMLSAIDLYLLPEGCIAGIVSFTSPRDACRFASISRIFKSAADSDAVWERFLPSDYDQILARSNGGGADLDYASKKHLFMLLACTPLLLEHGALSFSLEKSSGKKCVTIAARKLSITWGDTPKYWAWRSDPESRFSEVAVLLNVCWLEIKGKVQTSLLSPNTNYAAYLVFKMASDAFGFYPPVEVVVKTSGGKVEKGNVYLESLDRYQLVPRRVGVFNQIRAPLSRVQSTNEEDDGKRPKERSDKWLEVKIGEFSVPPGDEDGEVELLVMEVKAGNWKGGLVIEGIEIRPRMVK